MNWRKVVLPVLVLALAAAATGCKTFNLFSDTKTVDYKSAGKLPALDIPPDLVQPVIDERYSIPELMEPTSTTYSAYSGERGVQQKGGGSAFLPSSIQNVHIERAGTQRWLVVPQPPEAIWPVIKEFWQELGFLIKIEVPEAGIMETDWAENRAKLPQDIIRSSIGKVFDSLYSTAERDKFRTRLEKGSESGTLEIYISHRGMYEVYVNEGKSETRWQPRPADPELEAEMLRRLMVRLGVEETRAKTMVSGGQLQERAKLSRSA